MYLLWKITIKAKTIAFTSNSRKFKLVGNPELTMSPPPRLESEISRIIAAKSF
jgi:hypothetical protein